MTMRRYTAADTLLIQFDQAMRTLLGHSASGRASPAGTAPQTPMTAAEQRQAVRLMRVNHTGEICAQALYQGQAATARQPQVRAHLEQAAAEEHDHLAWCNTRLTELGSRGSILNPLFYIGALVIGAGNGKLGDRWSLGFVAETERQVIRHLQAHLERLPAQDRKSRAVLEAIQADEGHHANQALAAGGSRLPLPVRLLMRAAAKVMTGTTYWV